MAQGGVGVCVCRVEQGYLGSICDQCAPGFLPSATSPGTCVHVESSGALAAARAKTIPTSSGGGVSNGEWFSPFFP